MSSWSAEHSAFIADALRVGDGLGSSVRLRVHGESMLPALWPGHVVEIASCSLEALHNGDIVLALRDNRVFLHRLVSTQKNAFVLRGDSMPGPDPQYSTEALLGRLVRGVDLTNRRGLPAIAWCRAVGALFCHCSVLRRLALKLHSRRRALKDEVQAVECL